MELVHFCHLASLFEFHRVLTEVNTEEKLQDEAGRNCLENTLIVKLERQKFKWLVHPKIQLIMTKYITYS